MKISYENIDLFIQILEDLKNDTNAAYLRPHVEELLKAAIIKKVEYETIIHQ